MRRALAPLALTCLLAVAGCGSSSGGSTPSADSPGDDASSAPAPGTPPAGTTEPTQAQTPAPTSTPTSTVPGSSPSTTVPPPTPSTTPTDTATTSPTDDSGTSSSSAVRTYGRLKVTLPVGETTVPDAPPGLTAYLRTLLQKDWRSLGHTRDCRKSGVVILKATSANGFAYGTHEIDVTPSGGCMKAATMGGGYRAIWKSVGGTWKQILAMQDVPDCSTFEKWDVPSALLGKDAQCYDGSSVVAYQHD